MKRKNSNKHKDINQPEQCKQQPMILEKVQTYLAW